MEACALKAPKGGNCALCMYIVHAPYSTTVYIVHNIPPMWSLLRWVGWLSWPTALVPVHTYRNSVLGSQIGKLREFPTALRCIASQMCQAVEFLESESESKRKMAGVAPWEWMLDSQVNLGVVEGGKDLCVVGFPKGTGKSKKGFSSHCMYSVHM